MTNSRGSSDGSDLHTRPGQPNEGACRVPPQVLRAHKGFGRGSISQLQTIHGKRLLLSLSGDGVNLHALPDVLLKGQADR